MIRFRPAILGAAFLAAAGSSAPAQDTNEQATEEIVIYAPYIVHITEGPSGRPMQPVRIVTVARHVSYAGLDLGKPADAAAFEKAIHDSANEVCRELDRRMRKPGYQPITDLRACTAKAAREGLATAKQIIAAQRGN